MDSIHLSVNANTHQIGCPNTISQSNGIAIIAANVHGADTGRLSVMILIKNSIIF